MRNTAQWGEQQHLLWQLCGDTELWCKAPFLAGLFWFLVTTASRVQSCKGFWKGPEQPSECRTNKWEWTQAAEILEAVPCVACLAALTRTSQTTVSAPRLPTNLCTWACQPGRWRCNLNRCASGGKCTVRFIVWCQSNKTENTEWWKENNRTVGLEPFLISRAFCNAEHQYWLILFLGLLTFYLCALLEIVDNFYRASLFRPVCWRSVQAHSGALWISRIALNVGLSKLKLVKS